jgi:UDP-GlcNAc:undecaprenyl-phosphate GlcNAc-1-phosphate transferase
MLGMTAPLLAVAIPLLDTGLAIARRIVRHQPVFGGDAGHIHHRLLARGLTPRRVALVLYALTGCAAGCSLLLSMADNEFGGLVIVLFCAGAWLGIQHLGYTEFGVARRMLFQGVFGDLVDAHVTLRSLEEELRKADTAEECWEAVRRSCREFGFSDAALRLGGRTFEAHFPRTIGAECWSLRVPLSGSDHLALARPFQTEAMPGIVDPFVELVRSVLRPRLAAVELRRVNEEDEGERKAASA